MENNAPSIKPRIYAVDIRKFVVIPPEVDTDKISSLVKNHGLELNPIGRSTNLFTIDKFNVPYAQLDDAIDAIGEVMEEIKEYQVNYLEDKKKGIAIESNIIDSVSKFLVEANKDSTADPSKLYIILQTILGNLYKHRRGEVEFFDDETLEHLAKATVSKTLRSAKLNLNKTLVKMLIQIRKLTILWFYESMGLIYLNVRTDRNAVSTLDKSKQVDFNGIPYDIIPLHIQGKRFRILFNDNAFSITTFDTGRKNQDMVIPFLFSIFVDKACLKLRHEYINIIIKAVQRLKNEIVHQMKALEYKYDEKSLDALKNEMASAENSLEFAYRMLSNLANGVSCDNETIRRYYMITYRRTLARYFGGAISNSITRASPVEILPWLKSQEQSINLLVKEFSELKHQVMTLMSQLIQAKKDNNPSLFKVAAKKFQEVIENISAKAIVEYLKKQNP